MFNRSTTKILVVALVLSSGCATGVAIGNAAAEFAVTLQTHPQTTGELTTTGKVKINGHEVGNGFNVTTGSTASTAKGSSAVVSLGKLGRVEVFPSSSVTLTSIMAVSKSSSKLGESGFHQAAASPPPCRQRMERWSQTALRRIRSL